MTTTVDITVGKDTWTDDVALGATSLTVQADDIFSVIAYVGPTKPSENSRVGVPVSSTGTHFTVQAGDSVFLLSKSGQSNVTLIRGTESAAGGGATDATLNSLFGLQGLRHQPWPRALLEPPAGFGRLLMF